MTMMIVLQCPKGSIPVTHDCRRRRRRATPNTKGRQGNVIRAAWIHNEITPFTQSGAAAVDAAAAAQRQGITGAIAAV